MTDHKFNAKLHAADMLAKTNVISFGHGLVNGEHVLIAGVSKKLPTVHLNRNDMVPAQINGMPVQVIETGIIRAQFDPKLRHRPAPGGVSIGHYDITAGTLGVVVRHKETGMWVVLSNNHVLANSNAAQIGDEILQPGTYDGGMIDSDTIGYLEDFVEIAFDDNGGGGGGGLPDLPDGCNPFTRLFKKKKDDLKAFAGPNLVDAAIASLNQDDDVLLEVQQIGRPQGLVEAEIGMQLQKYGRTTEYTTGTVQQLDATVQVQYGEGKIATFEDQILTSAMSQGGDSGSAVFDMNGNLTGLLYAGSDTVTVLNKIQHVFDLLGLELITD